MYLYSGLLDDQATQLIPLKQKQGKNITLTTLIINFNI